MKKHTAPSRQATYRLNHATHARLGRLDDELGLGNAGTIELAVWLLEETLATWGKMGAEVLRATQEAAKKDG